MKCKHELAMQRHFTGVITTYHEKNGHIWHNREYDPISKDTMVCVKCDKVWSINKSTPKFVMDEYKLLIEAK